MENVKYLVLGAGPAGLAFANMLKQRGENSFRVVEKEKEAGGLCRSVQVDGSAFDIGGGHFLDVRRPKVNEFLFQFMPQNEWKLFDRNSVIDVNGTVVSHPLEANIWQFGMDEQIAYLESIAKAGCNREQAMPEHFIDWIVWKLGDKIAKDYMIPYNKKMFADELDELGTYWLEKLPNVSFSETLRSCLMHKPYGTQPGHAQFYYPRSYGYGELWLRMAEAITDQMVYGVSAAEIDFESREVMFDNGDKVRADVIIQTVPWNSFVNIHGISDEMNDNVKRLKHSAIETRYVPEKLDTDAQWIYIPDETKPYHRILVRHNFCTNSKGYWLETRKERTVEYIENKEYHYLNEYAYPLNTIDKPQIMDKLLKTARQNGIYGLGRWGEHSHFNSDVVVERAMKLAEELV